MGDEEVDADVAGLEQGFWPPSAELERWLMNAAKEKGAGSGFLRRILNSNPAYGSFLVGDDDLAGIVRLHAKKFRAKIIGSERLIREDSAAKLLYEPLCEVCWRVIGHLFHCLFDLEDTDRQFPVPKEPLGQVKMLIQSNETLSKKLNDMRRQYLRELAVHRDRQRIYTERAEAALEILEDQPVMFYEPLEFVLDSETKQFVQEVVEERLKLDMSQVQRKVKKERKDTSEIEEQDQNSKMYQELCKLRAALEREKAKAQRESAEAQRLRESTAKYKEVIEQNEQEIGDLRAEVENLRKQRNDLTKQLQQRGPDGEEEETGQPHIQVIEKVVEREVIVEKLVEVHVQIGEKVVNGSDNSEELAKLQEQIEELERLLEEERNKPPEVQIQETVRTVKEKSGKDKTIFVRPPSAQKKKGGGPEVQIKEVYVEVEDPKLRLELEKYMEVEKQLREANKALEKALEESKVKPQYRAPATGDKRSVDDDIADAIEKVTEEHKKKARAQADEIARLKMLLEEMEAANAKRKKPKQDTDVEEDSPKKVKTKTEVVVDTTGSEKWKSKYMELQDQFDDLQVRHDDLEDQVRLLLVKIKKIGGQDAVDDVMRDLKIRQPPPRKPKKEKAFERLYRDALRRIDGMQARVQARAEALENEESKMIFKATAYVRDRRTLSQVVNLTHLQKAAKATQSRFHEALTSFHTENSLQALPEGGDDSGTSDAEEAGLERGGWGDGWVPELVTKEFQRLRGAHVVLTEEVQRLRALLPAGAAAVAYSVHTSGMDRLAVLRAERGPKVPQGETVRPVLSSAPLFDPLSMRATAGRGTREAQMVTMHDVRTGSAPDRSSSPPPTPATPPTGSRQPPLTGSASAPSLSASWRPVAPDAAQRSSLGEGHGTGALLRWETPPGSTPPTPPLRGELGYSRPSSRGSASGVQGSSRPLSGGVGGSRSPPGSAASAARRSRSSTALQGSAEARPHTHSSSLSVGNLDSFFAGSSASTTWGPHGSTRGSEELSVDQSQPPPPAQSSPSRSQPPPPGQSSPSRSRPSSVQRASDLPGGDKGPKRRSRPKEDNQINAPVKARPSGMCVTALRSQEHLSSLPELR